MPNYRVTVEYEGTRYHGWQEQKNARSVAGEIRRAAGEAGAEVQELAGSGRTDAGVHAIAQTAHLRVARAIVPVAFREAVNDRLPPDIHVLDVSPAPFRFHARHDAVARSYLYQISRRRTALGKRFVWWIRRPIDASLLRRAASMMEGRHDFALLCEHPEQQADTRVVVDRVEVVEEGDLVVLRFVASHFLWKMVRRAVGSLVRVGGSDLDLASWSALLDRGPLPEGVDPPARWTAPPSGLFLERVLYRGDPELSKVRSVLRVGS